MRSGAGAGGPRSGGDADQERAQPRDDEAATEIREQVGRIRVCILFGRIYLDYKS